MISGMLASLRYWLGLTLGRIQPKHEEHRRYQQIARTIFTASVARGLSVVVSFISIPITVRYLGAERYGIWITVSSLLFFLNFTDLGIGSSVINLVAEANATGQRDLARSYVSSTFWLLVGIAVILGIASPAAWSWLGHQLFPGIVQPAVRSEVTWTIGITITLFLISFPLIIVSRVLIAHQETNLSYLWAIAGSVANLIAILLVVYFKGGLPWLSLSFSGLGLLVTLASAIWLFSYHKPWLSPRLTFFDTKTARKLFASSWKFSAISILWMINSQTDNFIIAHYLGASAVTPYSVTFRLFSYASLLQTFAYVSLWPAYSEAFAKREFRWIKRAFRNSLIFGLLTTVPITALFMLSGRMIIRVWAGPEAVPPTNVLIWMGVWNIMLSGIFATGCLLNAVGRLKGMTIYGAATAVLNIGLSIILVQRYGIVGAIIGTVIAYDVANVIPIAIEVSSLLRGLQSSEP